MLILNDVHLGFSRAGGTTPASRETLRTYLFTALRLMLGSTGERHLFINGDLFDGFEITPRDWVEAFTIFTAWLERGNRLTLAAGNHDHSPKAQRVSSFEMLCEVLKKTDYPVDVVGIDDWDEIEGRPGAYVLAHCSNQDIFDQKLAEILTHVDDGDLIFLHANYDNNFAAESDHSLNVSADVARKFSAKGAKLVFAHEHQAKKALGGDVIVMGNQWPTSIADCLGNDEKFAHVLKDGELTKIRTWGRDDAVGGFAEIDWRELADSETDAGFIRVIGDATSNEASDVINAISKFRSKSDAFVLTNSVKIDGVAEAEALPANFEAVKKFDVMDYIAKHLDAEELACVNELMADES